jgi:hypothetical protein
MVAMTVKMLFFITVWTTIGGFLGFMVIGIVEQMDRWRQERGR